jgi:hypothetical protein
MERVKRKPLAGPIREQLDDLAAAEEIFDSERQELGHSMTCEAGANHGADIVHSQTAGNCDPELLAPTLELPRKRPTSDGVQIKDAFVARFAELRGCAGRPCVAR